MKRYFAYLILGILFLTIQPASASDAWSDDFSGELSDWDIPYGEFTTDNGELVSSGTEKDVNSIWRNSSDVLGTWSIDVFRDNDDINPTIFPIAFDKESYFGAQPTKGVYVLYDYDKLIEHDLDPTTATIGLGIIDSPLITKLGLYSANDLLLGWTSLKIIINELYEIRVYLNDKLIIGPVVYATYKTNDYFNINVQPGAKFDNITYSPDFTLPASNSKEGISTTELLIGFSIASIVALASWRIYLTIGPSPIFDGDLYGSQHQQIKELFHSQTILYYTLVGQSRISDKEIADDLKKCIPRDIFEFKYLLHPVRLSFMKLLYESIELTSIELRDILEVKWNEYYAHLKILKKNKLVRVEDKFKDGLKRQILSLEPKGAEEYRTLTDLLHVFLDNTTNYKNYIETAQIKLKDNDRDMYPVQ